MGAGKHDFPKNGIKNIFLKAEIFLAWIGVAERKRDIGDIHPRPGKQLASNFKTRPIKLRSSESEHALGVDTLELAAF